MHRVVNYPYLKKFKQRKTKGKGLRDYIRRDHSLGTDRLGSYCAALAKLTTNTILDLGNGAYPFSASLNVFPGGKSRKVSLITALVSGRAFNLRGSDFRICNVFPLSGSKTVSCSARNCCKTSERVVKL